MTNDKTEIRASNKHGQGTFAVEGFKKGEEVYKVDAEHRTINHSCEPNVKEDDGVGYATRDIKPGEELTIDYNLGVVDEPFLCNCASKNCIGIIVGTKANAM